MTLQLPHQAPTRGDGDIGPHRNPHTHKQSNTTTCPSTPRSITQTWKGEALTLATMWMDPENMMLSEEQT